MDSLLQDKDEEISMQNRETIQALTKDLVLKAERLNQIVIRSVNIKEEDAMISDAQFSFAVYNLEKIAKSAMSFLEDN